MKKIVKILLIVGGLNWGLMGLTGLNIIAKLGDPVARIVYILVGIAALIAVAKCCKCCPSSCCSSDDKNQDCCQK